MKITREFCPGDFVHIAPRVALLWVEGGLTAVRGDSCCAMKCRQFGDLGS